MQKVEDGKADVVLWRFLLYCLMRQGYSDAIRNTVNRRGWNEKKHAPDDQLEKRLDLLTVDQLRGLVFELVIARSSYWTYSPGVGAIGIDHQYGRVRPFHPYTGDAIAYAGPA